MILNGEVKEIREYTGIKGKFSVLRIKDNESKKGKVYRVIPANGEKVGQTVRMSVEVSAKTFKNDKGEFAPVITLRKING